MKVGKNTKRNILIGFGLIFLGVIIIIFFTHHIRSSTPNNKAKFNNTSNSPDVGGLLAHMMSVEDFENMVKNDDINLSLMTDCASVNRHTCSAWTYLRRDLPPMIFIIPGTQTPTCGILIDPATSWPLLTTMGVIDSATDARNCCTNETGFSNIMRWPNDNTNCISKILQDKYNDKYANYAVYMPNKNNGGSCPTTCDEDDLFCKYNNSGGTIDYNDMLTWPNCYNGEYNDCFEFTEVDESKVPASIKQQLKSHNPSGYLIQSAKKSCKSCSKPYLCVTKTPPNEQTKKLPIEEDKQFSGYVNPDGSNWTNLYMPENIELISGYTMIRQCKYEKKDWNAWINSLKNYYNTMIAGLNPNNTYKNDSYDWQIANPDRNFVYLENEVNMYVNPDKSSSTRKDEHKIFIDSIVGFFYVGSTCEQQLAPLNGIQTQADEDSCIYYDAEDRCNGYYKMNGEDRRDLEQKRMVRSKNAVVNMVKWFNDKYNKSVVGYSAYPQSNAFANYKNWTQALTVGENVKFEQLFQPISMS